MKMHPYLKYGLSFWTLIIFSGVIYYAQVPASQRAYWAGSRYPLYELASEYIDKNEKICRKLITGKLTEKQAVKKLAGMDWMWEDENFREQCLERFRLGIWLDKINNPVVREDAINRLNGELEDDAAIISRLRKEEAHLSTFALFSIALAGLTYFLFRDRA